jgi:hypothetical protein
MGLCVDGSDEQRKQAYGKGNSNPMPPWIPDHFHLLDPTSRFS